MKWIVEMPDDWCGHCVETCENCAFMVAEPCPLLVAKKAKEVASGKVREATMVEEATYIGKTDISMAFKDGKNVSVYEIEED